MTTPLRHLIDQNPLKIHKEIERNEQSIQLYLDKINDISKENDKLRLILDPPKTKKRKLQEVLKAESHLIEELNQAKKKKKEIQLEIQNKIKPMDREIETLEKSLQKIDHQNCLILFDRHDLSDITDNHYGIVKYQQCSRCLFREYSQA